MANLELISMQYTFEYQDNEKSYVATITYYENTDTYHVEVVDEEYNEVIEIPEDLKKALKQEFPTLYI